MVVLSEGTSVTHDDENKVVWRKPTMGEMIGAFVFLMVWATLVAAAILTVAEAH